MTSIAGTILYRLVPLITLALLAMGAWVENRVEVGFRDALDRRLLVMAGVVASAVEVGRDGSVAFQQNDVAFALSAAGLPSPVSRSPRAIYRVWDEGGRIVASSPTFKLPALPAEGQPSFSTRTIYGREFRVHVMLLSRMPGGAPRYGAPAGQADSPSLPGGGAQARQFVVLVGLDARELKEGLQLLRFRMSVGLGALFLLLVALPVWIVRGALRPLSRLSAFAETIGPEDPGPKLPEEGVADEVRTLVRAFNRALGRLGEALSRERRFTADAAHELRTPLAVIRTSCEVALRRPRAAEELRSTLETVQRLCLRLSASVEDLLSLARLQQEGSAEILSRRANLVRSATEAAGVHAPAAQAKGVSLRTNLPSAIWVHGDERLLVECLSTLIENAVRYTPSGGRVEVTGGALPGPWIAVEDTGIGISDEHLPRIFDRFYRADPARSGPDSGSGLGLSIAREIARLHDAEVLVQSTLGAGSRFELRFSSGDARTRGASAQS